MTANNANNQSCPYCGMWWHSGMCPRIKAIEYHPNGQIKRVVLFALSNEGGGDGPV
jgi:hypothetical protein